MTAIQTAKLILGTILTFFGLLQTAMVVSTGLGSLFLWAIVISMLMSGLVLLKQALARKSKLTPVRRNRHS